MFWDRVAWAYDLFANIYNGKTHRELCRVVAGLLFTTDDVLECACGTGMLTVHIAPVCHQIVATDFSHKMLRPTPDEGLSDAANMLELDKLEEIIKELEEVRRS